MPGQRSIFLNSPRRVSVWTIPCVPFEALSSPVDCVILSDVFSLSGRYGLRNFSLKPCPHLRTMATDSPRALSADSLRGLSACRWCTVFCVHT